MAPDRLSFREKFVDACDVDGVVVRQYASSEAFVKATGTTGTTGTTTRDDDDDDDDDDAVPATGFTVWDASVLLGKYVGRERTWRRLTKKAREDARGPTTLELGAGTGTGDAARRGGAGKRGGRGGDGVRDDGFKAGRAADADERAGE